MNCVRNNSVDEGRELEMFPPFLFMSGDFLIFVR